MFLYCNRAHTCSLRASLNTWHCIYLDAVWLHWQTFVCLLMIKCKRFGAWGFLFLLTSQHSSIYSALTTLLINAYCLLCLELPLISSRWCFIIYITMLRTRVCYLYVVGSHFNCTVCIYLPSWHLHFKVCCQFQFRKLMNNLFNLSVFTTRICFLGW